MSPITHPPLHALVHTAGTKRSLTWYLTWGFIVVLLAASWQGADMRPVELFRDSSNMASYAADFFPPNFRQWRLYVEEMVITLQIALWGTALAVITAVPMALLASSNIVPWWVYQPVRRLMDACRAINEMVFAMLFVVAVGLGPFAGVLALVGILCSLTQTRLRAVSLVVSGAAAVAAFALPLRLNILVAIAAAVAVCLLVEQTAWGKKAAA